MTRGDVKSFGKLDRIDWILRTAEKIQREICKGLRAIVYK